MEEKIKICTKCGDPNPATEEYFYKHSYHKDGLYTLCKKCTIKSSMKYFKNNKERMVIKQAEYNEKNKDKRKLDKRKWHLKQKGFTLEQYNALLEEQGGTCSVCPATPESTPHGVLAVDHCHATGKNRGLLCMKCNSAAGLLNDDPERCRKLADYLEKHKKEAAIE